jgi:hypothetical protein
VRHMGVPEPLVVWGPPHMHRGDMAEALFHHAVRGR